MTQPSTNNPPPKFYDAGEAAMVIEFGSTVDPVINSRVLALDAKLAGRNLEGIRELVPTYRSLMVHYDPLALPRQTLRDEISALLLELDEVGNVAGGRNWRLPCCYDGGYGEDLDEVAGITGLSRQEVVAAHTVSEYRIYMYGFAPAYCYLGGLVDRLQIPRRQKPRPPHAAGAVMIGGGLASITTFAMPTGWYVVGRTPIKLYDPRRSDPFLMRPGDAVRFTQIGADEFAQYEARLVAGEDVTRDIEDTGAKP